MKYTIEQRLEIGKQIYCNTISSYAAAAKYGINASTARDYMRLYRDKNNLPPKNHVFNEPVDDVKLIKDHKQIDYSDLESLTKSQIIDELIKARVDAERAKKGYTVKGGGREKEFIDLSNQNLK